MFVISAHEYHITANLIEIADMMILNRPLGWSICAGMPPVSHGFTTIAGQSPCSAANTYTECTLCFHGISGVCQLYLPKQTCARFHRN